MKRYILFLICAVALYGCGANGGSAPPGSTISINPSSFNSTEPATNAGHWNTNVLFFTISLKDSKGAPIQDANLTIDFPYAYPTEDFVVTLINARTGELLKTPTDARTDDFGLYILRFDYASGAGLEYTGDLIIRSGDTFQKATITVGKK